MGVLFSSKLIRVYSANEVINTSPEIINLIRRISNRLSSVSTFIFINNQLAGKCRWFMQSAVVSEGNQGHFMSRTIVSDDNQGHFMSRTIVGEGNHRYSIWRTIVRRDNQRYSMSRTIVLGGKCSLLLQWINYLYGKCRIWQLPLPSLLNKTNYRTSFLKLLLDKNHQSQLTTINNH